jgi:DNA-binding transcriptional regulator YiaG
MSERTKTYRTKSAKKSVLCVSEQGAVYRLPQTVLNKYVVHGEHTSKKMKELVEDALQDEKTDPFSEINAKYTKMGALLKAVRLREGLNQNEFADLIGVTQGDLSKMEHGKRSIGKMLIARIAKQFGSKIHS